MSVKKKLLKYVKDTLEHIIEGCGQFIHTRTLYNDIQLMLI